MHSLFSWTLVWTVCTFYYLLSRLFGLHFDIFSSRIHTPTTFFVEDAYWRRFCVLLCLHTHALLPAHCCVLVLRFSCTTGFCGLEVLGRWFRFRSTFYYTPATAPPLGWRFAHLHLHFAFVLVCHNAFTATPFGFTTTYATLPPALLRTATLPAHFPTCTAALPAYHYFLYDSTYSVYHRVLFVLCCLVHSYYSFLLCHYLHAVPHCHLYLPFRSCVPLLYHLPNTHVFFACRSYTCHHRCLLPFTTYLTLQFYFR